MRKLITAALLGCIATSLQAQVHEEYRGRALSLYLMALFAGSPVGALFQGVLGDTVGRRASVLIPAAVFAAWVAVAAVRYRRFRDLDGDQPVDEPPPAAAVPKAAPTTAPATVPTVLPPAAP